MNEKQLAFVWGFVGVVSAFILLTLGLGLFELINTEVQFQDDCASFVLNKSQPDLSSLGFQVLHPQFKKYHVNIDGWHYCIYPYEPDTVFTMYKEDGQFLE